jgi:hypothetical protein
VTCKREEILARLLVILNTVEDLAHVARNEDEFPEAVRPAAILLDGDEEAVAELARPWVKGRAYTVVQMNPLIVVSMGGKPEEIGTDINELMARVVTAVMADVELTSIVVANAQCGVYYIATDNRLNHSLAMDCDLQMRFGIRYTLLPIAP